MSSPKARALAACHEPTSRRESGVPVARLTCARAARSVDPTGTYNGDSDLQLERINVYFNEASGGACPGRPPAPRHAREGPDRPTHRA